MNNQLQTNDLFSKDWFFRIFKGALVGIGGILPGLSGGVLAVIFGLYDEILSFLGNITKNFWQNVRYFIPVGIGFVLGILLFSFVVKEAFGAYEGLFTCLFIGFVIGTFPSLYQQAGEQGRSTTDLAIMGVSALILFLLMVVGGSALTAVEPNFFVWLLSGALIGLGVIVPGMSPSNFLIYFGLYEKMSAGIAALDFSVIIPLALGGLICVLALAKVANWLFEHFYSKMYHFILGTVIGSSLAIFPTVVFPTFTAEGLAASGLSFFSNLLLSLVMLLAGVAFSLWFAKVEAKYSN
ncbi:MULTISPECIES: DUF368 domain-containing protein [Aerococcus]|uniref:DUF368 domain-containing protein n=1 Tax=Aerococcus sanguinicola TaxID=119206 RepID=A0A5N1GP20_9LACT|nr:MULTISPECIES: DUF368 domain-containing protein [Aerococcus]KAA9302076.1 DUF368 domain-containing protein [Aerococcus sanguinicola]MDK6368499.1 DUF368 domain-containing protein [Aerococcus sp. UMB9870]MDK6679582.1 DUF368 domain-containing protein [Aerococcus sp. UMB8608]MDK6686426.1 DUF368 domain-containing protein [Aerococcus sp. UMB8623]MDK6940952.1 DUF368 domain-containing protein [Aerococcus sp. UMB8487]